MIDSSVDPLQVKLERERTFRQWEQEAAQLRAEGYSSAREARLAKATLAVQDALKRAAAGDTSAAWGNTYNDPAPAFRTGTAASPDAPIPLLNMTFGVKFGIAVVLLLVIGFFWVREKVNY